MIDRHLLKLRRRDPVSAEEEQALRALPAATRLVSPDTVLVHAGTVLDTSILLLDGIMCRFKDLEDGRRQITELQVPGDFVDLHGFTLKRLDHSILTLTECRIALVPHDRLRKLTEDHPHLTRLYWFHTNLDAAIHREWQLSLGRRTSLGRLAQLLVETYYRMEVVGLTKGTTYPFALTQSDLAECLGLTPVHVNRTLRELRERHLVEVRHGRVTIHDLPGLEEVAEFDSSYLYLDRRNR